MPDKASNFKLSNFSPEEEDLALLVLSEDGLAPTKNYSANFVVFNQSESESEWYSC